MTPRTFLQSLITFRRFRTARRKGIRHGHPRNLSRGLRLSCVVEARKGNRHKLRLWLDPAYRRLHERREVAA